MHISSGRYFFIQMNQMPITGLKFKIFHGSHKYWDRWITASTSRLQLCIEVLKDQWNLNKNSTIKNNHPEMKSFPGSCLNNAAEDYINSFSNMNYTHIACIRKI